MFRKETLKIKAQCVKMMDSLLPRFFGQLAQVDGLAALNDTYCPLTLACTKTVVHDDKMIRVRAWALLANLLGDQFTASDTVIGNSHGYKGRLLPVPKTICVNRNVT